MSKPAVRLRLTILLVLCLGPLCSAATWQEATTPDREQQKLLELRRAQVRVREAKAEFERQKSLYEQGLTAQSSLERSEADLAESRISYQQVFLELFRESSRISILEAVKSTTPDGGRFVTLRLENSSGPHLDFQQLGVDEEDAPLPDTLRIRELRNVFVSLRDANDVAVAKPYQAQIDRLSVGDSIELRFDLLKDVESVVVSVDYGGKEADYSVFLEKDANADLVTVQSSRFSQESDLGGEAVFDLRLERFTSESNVFRLLVVNLPSSIDRAFLVAADSETRLNQIKFTEGETTQDLVLRLHLPTVVREGDFRLDEPIRFWVLALDQDQAGRLGEAESFPESKIRAIKAGKVLLELVPRGVGELRLDVSNLYREILVSGEARLGGVLQNSGTREIRQVHTVVETPPNWVCKLEPEMIDRLDVDEKRTIEFSIRPGRGEPVGDYNVRIVAEAVSGNTALRSPVQIARIRVSAETAVWKPALLLLGLVLVVLVLVIVGVRIARR